MGLGRVRSGTAKVIRWWFEVTSHTVMARHLRFRIQVAGNTLSVAEFQLCKKRRREREMSMRFRRSVDTIRLSVALRHGETRSWEIGMSRPSTERGNLKDKRLWR